MPRRLDPLEADVQASIISFVRRCVAGGFVFHVANETGPVRVRDLDAYLAARRRMGVVPGAPDLAVFWPGGGLLWIECKRPGARAEPHQADVHRILRELGQPVAVCDSIDAAEAALAAAGAPLRVSAPLRRAISGARAPPQGSLM